MYDDNNLNVAVAELQIKMENMERNQNLLKVAMDSLCASVGHLIEAIFPGASKKQ